MCCTTVPPPPLSPFGDDVTLCSQCGVDEWQCVLYLHVTFRGQLQYIRKRKYSLWCQDRLGISTLVLSLSALFFSKVLTTSHYLFSVRLIVNVQSTTCWVNIVLTGNSHWIDYWNYFNNDGKSDQCGDIVQLLWDLGFHWQWCSLHVMLCFVCVWVSVYPLCARDKLCLYPTFMRLPFEPSV